MLNVPPADLQQRLRALARTVRTPAAATAPPPSTASGSPQGPDPNVAEAQLLEVLLNRPDLFPTVAEKVDPGDFSDPALASLAEGLWRLGHEGRCGLEELLCREEMSPHTALLARLAREGARRGNYDLTLAGALEFMAYRHQQRQLDELKSTARGGEGLRELDKALPRKNLRNYPKIS
jgi:hypothetical protein